MESLRATSGVIMVVFNQTSGSASRLSTRVKSQAIGVGLSSRCYEYCNTAGTGISKSLGKCTLPARLPDPFQTQQILQQFPPLYGRYTFPESLDENYAGELLVR